MLKFWLLILFVNSVVALEELRYSYYPPSPVGPDDWYRNVSPLCNGDRQSPINIDTNTVSYNPSFPSLYVSNWNGFPSRITATNNGYNINFEFDYPANQRPSVYGGPLDGVYEVQNLHYHFGREKNDGSEHTIDDKTYDGEEHLVMRNTKYSEDEALENADGLVVLTRLLSTDFDGEKGELIEVSLAPIFNSVREVDATIILNGSHLFSLEQVFGEIDIWGDSYFVYDGSMTSPDCNPVVTFVISDVPMKILEEDWDAFQEVEGLDNFIAPNVRPIQPLLSRNVVYYNNE